MDNIKDFFGDHDPETVMRLVQVGVDTFAREAGLEGNDIYEGLKDGNTAAQTLGLTRQDLEVLYAVGFNLLNSGDLTKAEDAFVHLCLIDPLEAKNHYCLGLSRQMAGKPAQAIDNYLNFLALDATNPDGYLRYGECLLATGDRAEALESFRLAAAEAEKVEGQAAALAEARGRIEMLTQEMAP
ncbi:hypothetical protein [Pseudooceanicola aestuarii]|uniref:hypothetical protein n=1 Tax=Pseudooceanicola aestuarii TaxID=2697319 RepID=UPI0013D2A9A2|nr:hypothetical protein [Pseudooceanicola aestuarii]